MKAHAIIFKKNQNENFKEHCHCKIIPTCVLNLRFILYVSVNYLVRMRVRLRFSLLVRSRNLNSIDNDNVAGIFGFIHIIEERREIYLSKHLPLAVVK